MTSKYAKYLLPIVLILIFASTASALPTTTHDTVRGEMYVSSTANWPSSYSTNNFDVPNGTVVFARYYVGVWAGQSTHDTITTTFNGHSFPTSPFYYFTDMGVTWIPYDVTDYLRPGEINTATINSKSWGDGRQYGSTLVVVLKNESKPQIEYWVAEGCDWMHYADYMGYEVPNSTTYFNGSLDLDNVQNASLHSTHLTGFNYEDLNGKSLPSISDSVGGEYFSYVRWDNVQSLLVPENQTVLVSRGSDTYCSVVFHGLSIEYKAADLVPVNLTPTTVVPNTSNTMTATIENRGSKSSQPFNVSLILNGTVVDTQPSVELVVGGSTTIDLHWTPDGNADSYSMKVVVDPDNKVVESDESNNILTSLVGTTSASSPVAYFSADKTSGNAPLTVTFTDQSTNSPISWAWDFENDGTVDSNEQNPIHIYSIPGTYTVNLTVTNAGGTNSSVNVDYITIFTAPPVAEFSADKTSGDVPLTVNFTDQSTNSPASWAWDFENDGVIDSTEQNPTHILSTPGVYTVNLTVTNAGGTNFILKTRYITVSAPGPIWTAKSSWNTPDIGSYAAPCLVDLDDDGDYDLLIGTGYGITYGYENTAILKSSSPDLSPTDVTLPSSVYASIPCTATATIINTGTGNAGAFNATLSVNGTAVDTQLVSGLAAGSSTSVNFSWTPEAAGDYNLTVTADPENAIAESDETNNALTITATVSAAPTIPDTTNPVIESFVLFPANTTAGATINFSVNATDNVEVTEVTAGDIKLNNTDGIWKGNVTAPSALGDYSLSINATDAAGNTVNTSVPYRVVQLSGGANIAVSPRSSSVAAGNNGSLAIKVKNTQNIDDTFNVKISVSELPASYQADLSWFDWTEKTITLKAGEEVLVPVKVTVPEGSAVGRKLFRANVKSETSSITGFDTGYLTIS